MTGRRISPGGGWYTASSRPSWRDRASSSSWGRSERDPKSEGRRTRGAVGSLPGDAGRFDKVQALVVKEDAPWVFDHRSRADMVLTFRNFPQLGRQPDVDNVLVGR